MKKVLYINILLSVSVFANVVWVTPSNVMCEKNKGKIGTYGVCQAHWKDAKKICRLYDGRLPTVEELKQEVKKCKIKSNKKDEYVACYKKNGFTGSSSYWSSMSDKKYKESAYGMNFYSAIIAGGSKTNAVDVRCVKDDVR